MLLRSGRSDRLRGHPSSVARVPAERVANGFTLSPASSSPTLARILAMTDSLPLATVKDRFSELVDRVNREHDRVVVTRNGIPAVVVEFVYGDLADHPERVGKPLRFDLAGRHSARRGEYRIIYRIDHEHDTVAVEAVAPRATIYRRR